MATDHPLFLYRYMDRSTPRKDSPRFRARLAAAFVGPRQAQAEAAAALRLRAGIEVERAQWDGTPLWDRFITRAPLEEVLTALTVAVQSVRDGPYSFWVPGYVKHVNQAMREENIGLRMDKDGVIHYAVDEEFAAAHVATLAALDAPGLVAARSAYEDAVRHMDAHPADTKAALRSMFEALEILTKQTTGYDKLNEKVCRGYLKDNALRVLGGDAVQQRVITGMFDGFADWADAMHEYRHGQVDSFEKPTEQFTVFAFSTASGYLRLLAQIAVALQAAGAPPKGTR